MRIDRRTLLKGLGAAALTPTLASCAGRAPFPTSVTPALLRDRIKTVVVLMQENRSFDHMFGSLSLLEGRTDVDGLVAGMSNPDLEGQQIPIALADEQCVEDPDHGWSASHTQWDGGKCDGFVKVHEQEHGTADGHHVMGYLDRAMAPASYALADRYALCQRWFASVMGPTWPNRFFSLLASSDGVEGNQVLGDQKLPTLYSRLDDADIHWADYYGNLPFSMILPNHSIEQPEYQKLDQFFVAAAAGKLPRFVHIDPIYGMNDDHPPGHPMAGQILIASIYEALAQSPQWGECLFLVYYDEHGGFFDHVSPGKTVDQRPDFQQLGFRVPALVVSPYVKPQVSSTVFDHCSLIASVLRQHDLDPLNDRDAAANDIWSLLDEQLLLDGTPLSPIKLQPIPEDDAVIYAPQCTNAGGIGLHVRPGSAPSLGQPELEAFADAHPSSKDGRVDAMSTYAKCIEWAKLLGVVS
jgi:phospholipase C